VSNHRKLAVSVLAALSLAGSSCALAFQQPVVRLDGLRLGAVGLTGGTVYARVLVANPNRFALAADGLEYDFELGDPTRDDGWVRLADGVFDGDLRVEARDSAFVEVPIDFRFEGLGSAMRSVMQSGTIEYRMTGTVKVVNPVRRAVPYRRAGSVSLQRGR
jgi:LEA14-like dessication related protein